VKWVRLKGAGQFAEALEVRRKVSPDNVEDIENRLGAAIEGRVYE